MLKVITYLLRYGGRLFAKQGNDDNEPDYVTTAPPPASPTKTISVGNNAAFPGKRVLQVNHV